MLRSLAKLKSERFLVHSTYDRKTFSDYQDLNIAIQTAKQSGLPFHPNDVWLIKRDSSAETYVQNFGLSKSYYSEPSDGQEFRKLISKVDKALILYYPEKDIRFYGLHLVVQLNLAGKALFVRRLKV